MLSLAQANGAGKLTYLHPTNAIICSVSSNKGSPYCKPIFRMEIPSSENEIYSKLKY